MNTTARRRQAMEEVDAQLHGAHHGMQALLELLGACAQPVTLDARGLRALLAPLADGIEQAAQVQQLLLQPAPPRPPAFDRAAPIACPHDAQGLVR